MLTYNDTYNLFIWRGRFEDRELPRQAGFQWSKQGSCWYTGSKYIAYSLRAGAKGRAADILAEIDRNIAYSREKTPVIEPGDGLYEFQAAGVETLYKQYLRGRRYLLLADSPGLGKSAQSLKFAKKIGAEKLRVICPASLRLNWLREIDMWHGGPAQAHLSGKQGLDYSESIVTSYALAEKTEGCEPDMVIVDESAAVKNPKAKRTKLILGDGQEYRGLIADVPALFLSGTPEPNGRPNEMYSILRRCAPDAIDGMTYWNFIRRFCTYIDNEFGGPVFTGAKNRRELYVRLRGSGFMVRRLKEEVLKDLPPKMYKMVVFPAEGDAVKVLRRERDFSAKEILEHGVPVGSALPEIRREMGLAKVGQSVEYIQGMLGEGVEKVVVFCHHVDVVTQIANRLAAYNPCVVMGSTKQVDRQKAVDAFQQDPNTRVFIGNSAAGEGLNLTAAQDVVFVEASWVPGDNTQRADRCHRIGQTGSVLIHFLVVEGSLDAHILGSAAGKADDIEQTLDGGAR